MSHLWKSSTLEYFPLHCSLTSCCLFELTQELSVLCLEMLRFETSALVNQALWQNNLYSKAARTSTLVPHPRRLSSTLVSPKIIVGARHGTIQTSSSVLFANYGLLSRARHFLLHPLRPLNQSRTCAKLPKARTSNIIPSLALCNCQASRYLDLMSLTS